jgi:putative spermidine/putrescine transport system ATP-binding protein
MGAKLEIEGLQKTYGDTVALRATDLCVNSGEFLTLLGPSGSGKTTLLQMIAGLVQPSAGAIRIDGRDVTFVEPGKRGIGMVFQAYALFPHMTVWDNVAYALRMRRRAPAQLREQVEAALEMVRMGAYARRYPKELSGGQQQRIALARCFAYRPSVILLDEPLGALDKKLREHMQIEIRRLHREVGATFIYVTHDQDEALTLSDRICLMNEGGIEQLGTPADLYDRPASCFAAGFIGHSNLLEGTLDAAAPPDGHARFMAAGRSLPLRPDAAPGPAAGGHALLLRPESLELVAPGQGYLDARVTGTVFLGSDIRVHLALADGTELIARCARPAAPRPDEAVGLRWATDHATLLRK